jgi:carbamoyl-phosphate synthase small subunit
MVMKNLIDQPNARLALDNGVIMHGLSLGVSGTTCAELVFNTGMSGYQETLSDSSYAMQFILFTTAYIGINGCNTQDNEAKKVHAKGCILLNPPTPGHHFRSEQSFTDYLIHHQLMALYNLDTRQLTRIIRNQGQMHACMSTDNTLTDKQLLQRCRQHPGYLGQPLAETLASTTAYVATQKSWHQQYNSLYANQGKLPKNKPSHPLHIVVVDLGCKEEILRRLADHNFKVTVISPHTPWSTIQTMHADGYLLSNGPGDPQPCTATLTLTKHLLQQDKPVLGICLGMQILALAAGAQTKKMNLGHHGINHPVLDIKHKQMMVTAQNHNYVVDEQTLPKTFKITHRSLFDQSIQGIAHTHKPIIGFQGHPEGGPGPLDPSHLFTHFYQETYAEKNNH